MDQSIISGVGNYIKSESLYRAEINPHDSANQLSDQRLEILRQKIISVMRESYQMQGATLSTFKNIDDKPGNFAQFLQVYKKKKNPNGLEVKVEKTPDQRTTYWVSQIQNKR